MAGPREARPIDPGVQRWVVLTLRYLDDLEEAARSGYHAAHTGVIMYPDERKFHGDLMYWKHVLDYIAWMRQHVPAWGSHHAWEDNADVSGSRRA